MTFSDKNIYNTFLRISRTKQSLPFKYRKKFDDFEDTENYFFVKKLSLFFQKFPQINIDDFINAPYEIYPDHQDFYDLRFYITPKATRVYGLYMKKKDDESPDCDMHIQQIKKSLLFIFQFCRDNNIQLDEYTCHTNNDIRSFIMHLKDRKVSIYTLFGFNDFETHLATCPKERLKFTLGENFTNNVAHYKLRYYNSNKAKYICKAGIEQIKKILQTKTNQL